MIDDLMHMFFTIAILFIAMGFIGAIAWILDAAFNLADRWYSLIERGWEHD